MANGEKIDPQDLHIRITELHNAVKTLTDSVAKMEATRIQCFECSCGPCNECSVCHVCHVCRICRICKICQCFECSCGPCQAGGGGGGQF